MGPNCLVPVILGVIGCDLDGAAVCIQSKMMRGLVVGEPHGLIAVFFYIGLMLRSLFHMLLVHRTRVHILRCECDASEQQKYWNPSHLAFLPRSLCATARLAGALLRLY